MKELTDKKEMSYVDAQDLLFKEGLKSMQNKKILILIQRTMWESPSVPFTII